MKKILYIITLAALFLLNSCTFNDTDSGVDAGDGRLRFTYNVLKSGGTGTRAETIPSETGEDMVYSLAFIFFEKSDDGSGAYKGYSIVENASGFKMNASNTLTLPAGVSGTSSYNLLVAANLDRSNYIPGSIAEWCEGLSTYTEKQAKQRAAVAAKGSDDFATDSTARIPQNGLVMSGSTVLNAGQTVVSVELTRGVARYDVYTASVVTDYELVSASIWNGFPELSMWTSQGVDYSQSRLQRFYGIELATEGRDIVGGLYSFENYVYEPDNRDAYSTCVILGYRGTDSKVTYHRLNVRPDSEVSQSLIRNNVYKINVTDILGPGKSTELDAYTSNENNLVCGIYEWGVDTSDLIQSKDGNILGIPAKKVRIAPEGETKSLSIFTMGNGILSISRFETDPLRPGLSAWLDGNSLMIKGEPFQGLEDDKEAVVEVSFAGMKALISIIQSASGDVYLELSTNNVPVFAPTAGSGMSGGGIQVSASGSWNARLAVNSTPDGDVFTFQAGTDKNILSSNETVANIITITTRTANTGSSVREAVLIVALDADPGITRTVVLSQTAVPTITTSPSVSSITFDAYGNPTSPNVLVINPGSGLDVNSWTPSIVGGDDTKFSVSKNVSEGSVTVTADFNTLDRNLSAKLRISLTAETYLDIPITQSNLGLSYTPSSPELVPVTGGDSQEITIQADTEVRKWKVELIATRTTSGTSLSNTHEAKLVRGGSEVTRFNGVGSTDKIVVRFPKLLTPDVNVMPEAVLKVTLLNDDNSEMGISRTITVRQQMLVPRAVVIQSYNSGYFSFGQNNGSGGSVGGSRVSAFLRNEANFGPAGAVVTKSKITTPAYFNSGVVASATTLLHANRAIDLSQAHWNTSKAWWESKDGNTLLVTSDDGSSNQFDRFLGAQGYSRYSNTDSSGSRISVASGSQAGNPKLMAYLLDGPFGTVNPSNIKSFYADGVHTKLNTWPSTASPVITYNYNNGTWKPMLTIDVEKQLIYIAECQLFDGDSPGIPSAGGKPTNEKGRFLANIMSVWINLAQYGSHWGDNYK